jgi:hypothetical protein
MTPHKIKEFYVTWFRVCSNITSIFCTTAIFKTFVKQNNNSHRTCRYVHDILLCQVHFSKYNGSWVISTKQNTNPYFQQPSTFAFFTFHNNALIKIFHPLKICKNTFHGPTLTSSIFASTSEVWRSTILSQFMLKNLKCMTLRSPSTVSPPHQISYQSN